jgi:hypothetical protein
MNATPNNLFNITDNIFCIKHKEDISAEVKALFSYWREVGFPNYSRDEYDDYNEFKKLLQFDESTILDGNDLIQTMLGCGYLWTFFPHWVDVTYGNGSKSLMECWNDDEKLMSLIEKTYRWHQKHGGEEFTVNRLRQNAKVYCSSQSVSNFRPTVAKYIYNTYGKSGTVWDMSGGYGGRLFGFIASNCKRYIATDPCYNTHIGLTNLRDAHKGNTIGKSIELHLCGSEEFTPDYKSLDLCFTSPPYFNTEMYSQESSQSYKKFPTQDKWLDGFLRGTIKNCNFGLKDDGVLILNVANVKSLPTLENDTVRIATEEGFTLVDTKYLVLSSISGNGVKREPVFIFTKDGRPPIIEDTVKPSTLW